MYVVKDKNDIEYLDKLRDFPKRYGFKSGDTLTIIKGKELLFPDRIPDYVLVIKEYAYYILCEAIFFNRSNNKIFTRVHTCLLCINKAALHCKEIEIAEIEQ